MAFNDLALGAASAIPVPEVMRPHLGALVELALRKRCPLNLAVVYPCDRSSLMATRDAAMAGLVKPILVGPRGRMESVALESGIDLTGFDLHDTVDDPRIAAAQAAGLCRDGHAAALMKGSLHSDELLAAALARDAGLRTNRRTSHVFVLDVPDFNRPLLLTDCVVNIAPSMADKRDIAQNAIDFAHAMGIAKPHMAILSAMEHVNPAIQSTVDAAALCKMADRGQIVGAVLDGPLAFDNAISAESAVNKGIASAVAGHPDVLLVPTLEVGNMLYKQLVYMAGAECAGLVLGMRVPIVLTSRSDSIASRIASCALAVLASRAN